MSPLYHVTNFVHPMVLKLNASSIVLSIGTGKLMYTMSGFKVLCLRGMEGMP